MNNKTPEKNKNARFLAIKILTDRERSGLPVDRLLARTLTRFHLPDFRDRQLLMAMVYGVLRWQGRLDWLLGTYSRHPLAKMKPRTRQALRLGLFQLLFLERVPASAAINETVQALKEARQPKWLSGFVNGVLRTMARDLPAITHPSPDMPDTALYSLPAWLLARWRGRYGAAFEKLCDRFNQFPVLCLRTNTRLTGRDELLALLREKGLAGEPGRYAPEAVRLPGYQGAVTELPGYQQGLFQVQDESAQLVTRLMGPFTARGNYLDACAGPGGKTSHLVEMLTAAGNDQPVTAVEPDEHRLALLRENLERLRITDLVSIRPGTLEGTTRPGTEDFHGILVDAPCSGLGVIRRHPEIRWQREEKDLLRNQERQLTLLHAAGELTAAGGVLVYAACSQEPEENEMVVRRFLEGRSGFSTTDCRKCLPGAAGDLVDEDGFFRSRPEQTGMDGFFAARLRKNAYR